MENLYGTIGKHDPRYLLAANYVMEAIAISVEPGNGVIPAGAVMYRKSGALYAPAATGNIAVDKNLVILRDEVDSDQSSTVAVAAAAYRKGNFIAGKVLYNDSGEYKSVSAAHEITLREQGITLSPMDDWSGNAVEADNTASVSVTLTNDGNGSASASPDSGTKGTEVTLTATPASNYVFDYWEVISGDVTIANNKFTIGDKAVTVKAHFKAEE